MQIKAPSTSYKLTQDTIPPFQAAVDFGGKILLGVFMELRFQAFCLQIAIFVSCFHAFLCKLKVALVDIRGNMFLDSVFTCLEPPPPLSPALTLPGLLPFQVELPHLDMYYRITSDNNFLATWFKKGSFLTVPSMSHLLKDTNI